MALFVLLSCATLTFPPIPWPWYSHEGPGQAAAVGLFAAFAASVVTLGIVDWLLSDEIERRNRGRAATIRALLSAHVGYMVNVACPEGIAEIEGAVSRAFRDSSDDFPGLLTSHWSRLKPELIKVYRHLDDPVIERLIDQTNGLVPQLLWLTDIGGDVIAPDSVAELIGAYSALDAAARDLQAAKARGENLASVAGPGLIDAIGSLARAHRLLAGS